MIKNQRQIQKEQTRNKLLEVSFQEFAERGIMATRMSDIAQAAGVSHGTVFTHFSSQEILITTVIETFGEKVALRIHELSDEMGGVYDLLKAHLEGLLEFEAFYTRLLIEARLLPKIARDTLISIQSAISIHLSRAAQHEMETGKIKTMPLHLLFNTWLGLIHYYLANGDLFAPQDSVLRRHGSMLLDHFIGLISLNNENKGKE